MAAGATVKDFLIKRKPISAPEVIPEVTGEVTGEVRGEVAKLLLVCHGEMTRQEFQARLGLRSEETFATST